MTLSGVIAAVPTPLKDGAPDPERFHRHAAWALENGCDGLNVLGSTGEATSFSPQARKGLMRAAAASLPTGRLMVGTGAPDLETAIALTDLAGRLGFAGALVLPPYYYSNVDDAGLFAFFDALIRATEVPIYLYNFPQMTGLAFSPALVRRLKDAHPDRLRGAKDSSGDLTYAAELAGIADFDVFPSDETAWADTRYAGIISATANLTAPLAATVRAAPEGAERLGALRKAIAAQPLVPAVKHLVARRLGDDAFAEVLPPFRPLTAAERAALEPVAAELETL